MISFFTLYIHNFGRIGYIYIFLMGKLLSKAVFKSGTNTIAKEVPHDFFDLQAKDIDGKVVEFNVFKGKKALMIVNVACK